MSPVAHSGPALAPSNQAMASDARSDATRAARKGSLGGVPHSGHPGPAKAPFRHIDDIVSVDVDLDAHTPLRKVIEAGDKHMQQAITYKTFGRFDLALQEYIRAFAIAVDKVPKHKDYPSLGSDRGDLSRSYRALKAKITSNGAAYDTIKQIIKEDNQSSGVLPEKPVARSLQSLLLDLPSVPSSPPLQQSAENHHAAPPLSNGQSARPAPRIRDGHSPGRKAKPIVHPKPQALHGNSVIRPGPDKPSPDLVARFTKLRDPAESRNSSSPSPATKPAGPRAMPPTHRPPLSAHSSLPAMPRVPDAIYSPARGTVTSEAANLPSSTPRGMFSRTNSIVSLSGTSSRTSMESLLKTFSAEQFVTAHTYGDTQASPTRNFDIPEGDLITVKELLRHSANANTNILLIDVRDRDLFDEGHIKIQSTICLDPTILSRHNISASEIADSMILAPTTEKLAFERRDEFDLVVFYDQDSESIPQRATDSIQETIIFNLRQALIHLSFPKQLTRMPKLLVGGVDAWVGEKGQESLEKSRTQSVFRRGTSVSAGVRQRLRNRTLKPEEVDKFEALIGQDINGDFNYAKSRDDFMRRFPSLGEPESMVSDEQDSSLAQGTGPGGEDFLKDITPVPPVRPKPSVARTRYSGLESAEERSSSGALAFMATVKQPSVMLSPALSTTSSSAQKAGTGLINPGNWCYGNSSFQALFSCPGFRDEFFDPQWPTKYRPDISPGNPAYNQLMCRILGNLFHWLAQGTFTNMKASTLMHYLRTIHSGYTIGGGVRIRFGDTYQHDSDELITFIFGQLEVETRMNLTRNPLQQQLDTTTPVGFIVNRWRNRPQQSVISRYFYLMELHTFTCNNCKATNFLSEETERFQVPVPQVGNDGTLSKLLQDHFKEESVGSRCERCLSSGKTMRKQIARLPPLLRVIVIRTDQTSSIKLSNHLQFTLDGLNFGEFVLRSEQRRQVANLLGGQLADGFNSEASYRLYAVVAHAGTQLNSGHYICLVRSEDGNFWTQFNDSYVTPRIRTSDIKTRLWKCEGGFTPVHLYYQRVDAPFPQGTLPAANA